MQYLIFGVVILAVAVGCRTNVILIDGIPTERTQFCVGEELSLLCQNNIQSYVWEYPGGSIPVSRAQVMETANGFTATYINTTTTTLQFVVSSDMNGIIITCSNFITGYNISATNLKVLGMSSMMCPVDIFAFGMNNCSSVDVSLHGVSRCTREYSASISGDTTEVISSILSEVDHGAEKIDIGNFTLTKSSFESCSTYNVTINVTFFSNSSMTCSPVAVELPTNSAPTATSIPITAPSSTVAPASTATMPNSVSTTPPPPLTPSLDGPLIAIIVPVIVVGSVIVIIIITITIIIAKCVNNCKNQKSKTTMRCLIFGVAILAVADECRTNVILIDNIPTERTQFCVGEELTLLCQNSTAAYRWVYPGGNIEVSQANTMRNASGFTATYVNTTTTTLNFVVSSDMNEITIICFDFLAGNNISATNLKVLGMSSMMCPGDISAIVDDTFRYVNVSLRGISRCTREYNATISGEADIFSSVLNDTDCDVEMISIEIFKLTNRSLELCSTYNVTVNVTFFDNSSMLCSSVAVELPTKYSSTSITIISSTVVTASIVTSQGIPLLVVIVICVLVLGIIFIIVIIVIGCAIYKKVKKNKKKKSTNQTGHDEQNQTDTQQNFADTDIDASN